MSLPNRSADLRALIADLERAQALQTPEQREAIQAALHRLEGRVRGTPLREVMAGLADTPLLEKVQ